MRHEYGARGIVGATYDDLHFAIKMNNFETVETMLATHVNPVGFVQCDKTREYGRFAMTSACSVCEDERLLSTARDPAARERALRIVQLLSSYDAARDGVALSPEVYGSAIARWLRTSRGYTALHHIEVLTEDRAVALLQADRDSIFVAAADGSTPLSRARLLHAYPFDPFRALEWIRRRSVARLILLAVCPWSPQNEHLFPIKVRESAQFLKKLARCEYRLPAELWERIMVLAFSHTAPTATVTTVDDVNSFFQRLTL